MELPKKKYIFNSLPRNKKEGNGCENTKNHMHIFPGVNKSERAKAGLSK